MIAKIPTPRFSLPAWTGHFRYVVLLVSVLAIPFLFGEGHLLFICRLCPAGALEGGLPNVAAMAVAGQQVVWPNALKIAILVLPLTAMFFTWRPWCTLFCPLGAIYGLFNRVSAVFLRFHPERCNECGLCRQQCHYGVRPDRRANDPRCIRCLECTRCGAISVASVFGTGKGKRCERKGPRGG